MNPPVWPTGGPTLYILVSSDTRQTTCYGRAPVGPIVDRIKGLAQVI
jgi:hypothetical protein